jgi:hypothetical protein
MMKVQVQSQKVQNDAMKMQMDAQARMRELDIKEQETLIKSQVAQAQQMVDEARLEMEATIKSFAAQLDEQYLLLEKFKADIAAKESAIEEIRLAREADMEVVRMAKDVLESSKNPGSPEVKAEAPAPLQINIDAKGQTI